MFCTGTPRTGHNCPGLDHLPRPAGSALHDEAQDVFGICAMRPGCWLMVSLLCTRTLRSFSAVLFFSWLIISQSILLSEVILLHVQDITFPFKHCEIPVDPYLQPPEVPGNSPTTMCSFHNLPRVSPDPSSRSLMRKLNSASLSTGPWGAPRVTGLQMGYMPLTTALWSQHFTQISSYLTIHLSHPYSISLSVRML